MFEKFPTETDAESPPEHANDTVSGPADGSRIPKVVDEVPLRSVTSSSEESRMTPSGVGVVGVGVGAVGACATGGTGL